MAAARVERFPTGLAHYVYDVALVSGRRVVVRLTRPEWSASFRGAVYWYERLRPLGVPLPELFYADIEGTTAGFPALVMDRLPGTDLGNVYPSLRGDQRRRLAQEIVAIQRRVASLPAGPGFGYAFSYEDIRAFRSTWKEVLLASLESIRDAFADRGPVDPRVVDRVCAAVDAHGAYLAAVRPRPFLDDMTTKNVIVADGRLSGIVDVDCVTFGDALLTPALTRMALLARDYETDYVDHWMDALGATAEQRRMLTLYTACHCVTFLWEIGQPFNRGESPVPPDPALVQRRLAILESLLAAV